MFKLKILLAADHAGFELKNELRVYLESLGHVVHDCGAHTFNESDDYPDFIASAAEEVSRDPKNTRAIIIGGSGQGEAMVANRFLHVRAAVFYGERGTQKDATGETLGIIESSRVHNNANVLALGARFVTTEEARDAVTRFLETPFSEDSRHARRIEKIELHG